MKKITLLSIIVCFLFSCKTTYVVTPNGDKISQRKSDRITNRAVRKVFRKLSKEDYNILQNTKIIVETRDSTTILVE